MVGSRSAFNVTSDQKENYVSDKLYDDGWLVIYWTARGSMSGVDFKEFTLGQLDSWGCKYHDLQVGNKPPYDLLICDKTKRIEEIWF